MTRLRLVLVLGALAVFGTAAGPEAQAAFPGSIGRIAYTRTEGGASEIFSVTVAGTGEKQLTETEFDSCCPAWSPDGTQIAFFSNRGGNDDVYVMRADGSSEENISQHDADEGKADWSPDGTKIAFTSDRDGDFEVWVMNADGTSATQLTHNTGFNDYNPAWSPDGTKIAFESNRDDNREVYIMDAGGGNEQNLTQDPAEDGEPDWAPDGSRLAFHTDRDGNFDIYSIDPNGSDPQQLTDDPGSDLGPAWSPDGAKLAFSSNRSGHYQVHVLYLGTVQTTQVTSGDADALSPDWQPLSPVQGDVDCTGAVNSVDALGVLRAVAQMAPPAPCLEAGDVDCDGALRSVDALRILRYVAQIGVSVGLCTDIGEPLPDGLAGGVLATFDVAGERFKVWVTNESTIQQLFDLEAGYSNASIPNGLVVAGAGQGLHNLPWSWHLDAEDIEMAEITIEVCDGTPSYVQETLADWLGERYCPWTAELVSLEDHR
jgi:hypothetical protein